MRTTITVVALVFVTAACPAMDYFPFHNDAVYLYAGSGSAVGEASFSGSGRNFYYHDNGNFVHNDDYSVWNGHLMLESWEWGPSWEVRTYTLDPPACLLRQPLAVGDFWHTFSHVSAWPHDYDLHVIARVVDEVEITVPYGTLTTLHLTYEMVDADWGEDFSWSEVWLHEDLGIVRTGNWELTGIESTVRTEATTLANVRALFR